MGKWSYLKNDDGIDRMVGDGDDDDPNRREKVDRERDVLVEKFGAGLPENIAVLGELYAAARDERDKLEADAKKVGVRIQALVEMLVARMEATNVDSFKIPGVGNFILDDKPQPAYADPRAFIQWVKDNGMEDMLTMHHSRMLAMVKKRLEDGLEPPPGIDVRLKTGVQRRKA